MNRAEAIRERLTKTSGGCLEFPAPERDGKPDYGRVSNPNGSTLAHRIIWEDVHGPIPEGLQVCHHCDNPPCCNVDHLFLGTNQDNMADRNQKGRARGGLSGTTHCLKAGHPLTGDNISIAGSKRRCRECYNAYMRQYRASQKESK